MARSMDETIDILNDLIETCRDGEEGFRMASENVEDSEMRLLFDSYSRQRGKFVRELQQEVVRLGGDAEKHGSVAGSLHRGWINLKAAVTDHSTQQIVEECERGEDSAVSSYREALAKDVPADILAMIQNQYEQVTEAHGRIAALKHLGQRV